MTVSSESGWANDLIELLDRQRSLYVQLRQLSQQQCAIVGSDQPDVSGLVLLLGRRQNLIDHLARIGQQMEPYRRNWPGLWRSLDAPMRVRVQKLIEQVQELLDVILRQDEQDRVALSSRSDRATGHISRLDRS
jgi:flagellar biosynthesis/type III secretory pathway chaperone